jgi:hypothetical protein
VLLQSSFGLGMPNLPLVVRQVLPSETDNLRQSAVIRFDLGGDVLTLNERRPEEYKGIGRTGYVVLRFLLAVCRTARYRAIIGRGEEDCFARGINHGRRVIEGHGSDVGRKGNRGLGPHQLSAVISAVTGLLGSSSSFCGHILEGEGEVEKKGDIGKVRKN